MGTLLCVSLSDDRYIISVVSIDDIGEGKIMPGTGQARFKCSYTAIVMKPFKGEVVDGKVVNVNKVSSSAPELAHNRWASLPMSAHCKCSSLHM